MEFDRDDDPYVSDDSDAYDAGNDNACDNMNTGVSSLPTTQCHDNDLNMDMDIDFWSIPCSDISHKYTLYVGYNATGKSKYLRLSFLCISLRDTTQGICDKTPRGHVTERRGDVAGRRGDM